LATGDFLLTGQWFPSKVKITYLGKSRPVAGKRRDLLVLWRKSFPTVLPAEAEDLFSTEMLFQEGHKKCWIVVQKPLLESLRNEVKVGHPLVGYVVWVGAIKIGGHWEWVFAMNGFDAYKEP